MPFTVGRCAKLQAALGRVLLASVAELQEQRRAAVSADAYALRRIERDIHDGPQQHLVQSAVDLAATPRHGNGSLSPRPPRPGAVTMGRESRNQTVMGWPAFAACACGGSSAAPAIEAKLGTTRATQTNEVGRCALLLPVLAGLPQPVALLEVGAAADLATM